jgi:hypothetical protein
MPAAWAISSAELKRPNPNRRLERARSALKPSASNTWLGSGLVDVQALPLDTASRFNRIMSAWPST